MDNDKTTRRTKVPTESTLLLTDVCEEEAGVVQGPLPRPRETIIEDALDILNLGIPIAISYLSWVGVSRRI